MKNVKVFYLVIAFVFAGFMTQTASAQMSVGAGLSYGTEIEELGINIRFNYGFTEKIEGTANVTFWLVGEEGINFTTINLDAHYYFLDNEKFNVYGIGGLNIARTKIEFLGVSASDSEYGLNVGAGIDLGLSDALGFFGEVKYVIGDADQLALTAGVKYAF